MSDVILSKRSREMLLTLVERRIDRMDVLDRRDLRDLQILQECREILRGAAAPSAALADLVSRTEAARRVH